MLSTGQPQPVVAPAAARDAARAAWVTQYRGEVPTANRWAGGRCQRAHSIETQERVFRMAQQLAEHGIDRKDLFASLEEADRSVRTTIDPESVAEAGYRAIGPLLPRDGSPVMIDTDAAGPDLRSLGFDPVTFDGHDPAAHAWARFELTMRGRESRDEPPCSCHPRSLTSTTGLARL